jgi:hypothetical protein
MRAAASRIARRSMTGLAEEFATEVDLEAMGIMLA